MGGRWPARLVVVEAHRYMCSMKTTITGNYVLDVESRGPWSCSAPSEATEAF